MCPFQPAKTAEGGRECVIPLEMPLVIFQRNPSPLAPRNYSPGPCGESLSVCVCVCALVREIFMTSGCFSIWMNLCMCQWGNFCLHEEEMLVRGRPPSSERSNLSFHLACLLPAYARNVSNGVGKNDGGGVGCRDEGGRERRSDVSQTWRQIWCEANLPDVLTGDLLAPGHLSHWS